MLKLLNDSEIDQVAGGMNLPQADPSTINVRSSTLQHYVEVYGGVMGPALWAAYVTRVYTRVATGG